jgi:hypothetical protein
MHPTVRGRYIDLRLVSLGIECLLWSKSGQKWTRLNCPLSAKSGHRIFGVIAISAQFRLPPTFGQKQTQ